jgi:hypothetical protein
MKIRKRKPQPKKPPDTSQSVASRVRMTYAKKGFGATWYPKKD